MKKSLIERVTGWMVFQKRKHGFPDDYEIALVNQMTNYELLSAISEALAEEEREQEIKTL